MARQTGCITLKRTIGNITFIKFGNGYVVKSRGDISARKIATHLSFQRTRENNAEFSTAAKAGMLLRTSLRSTIINAKVSSMVNRLISQMLRVLHAATVNFGGLRDITGGDTCLLKGFNFNNGATSSATVATGMMTGSTFKTNLIEAYEELVASVARHLPDQFYMEGDQRVSLRTKTFREIVTNLIVHREYTNAHLCTFVIYKDHVETANVNTLHGEGPIDPGNFAPFPKNPAIARFFNQAVPLPIRILAPGGRRLLKHSYRILSFLSFSFGMLTKLFIRSFFLLCLLFLFPCFVFCCGWHRIFQYACKLVKIRFIHCLQH